MGLNYVDLDDKTRPLMRAESDLGGHYSSPRLTQTGLGKWVSLLNLAIESRNDDWLAESLIRGSLMRHQEPYIRNGKQFVRNINIPAASGQLAEGEFNRYFIRGLCCRALASGITHLVVYRGKAVKQPRPESEAKIGTLVHARQLLAVLRSNDFVSIEDALAVPGGPSSGLTVRLP